MSCLVMKVCGHAGLDKYFCVTYFVSQSGSGLIIPE